MKPASRWLLAVICAMTAVNTLLAIATGIGNAGGYAIFNILVFLGLLIYFSPSFVAFKTPEATMDSLNIDSLSMIEFLFEMEDRYGISLAESRAPLTTLGDVFKEIDKAIAAKDGTAS